MSLDENDEQLLAKCALLSTDPNKGTAVIKKDIRVMHAVFNNHKNEPDLQDIVASIGDGQMPLNQESLLTWYFGLD